MIEHRTGDLFAPMDDVDAKAHGVNCRGVMGAGVARVFRFKHPLMHVAYQQLCRAEREQLLGRVMSWPTEPFYDYRWLYNLFTQDLPGPDARLDAVRSSVTKMLTHAERNHVRTIALPRIGCGIGGLVWEDVAAVLEEVAASSPVRLIVITPPESTTP